MSEHASDGLGRLEPIRAQIAACCGATSAEPMWIVGGAVRDALLGRPLVDIDLVSTHEPRRVARALADELGGAAFELGARPGDASACWRVTLGAGSPIEQFDVCAVRGESLSSDLAARDFTANAMAFPVTGPAGLIDEHGGRADLEVGQLRMVAASGFDDDPLRMLRAARIAHSLSWTVHAETADAIRSRAHRATEPAGERTFHELGALLMQPGSRRGWQQLEALGLEPPLLPELDACRDVRQSEYHHLDVHDHTLAVLDNAEDLLDAAEFWLPLPAEPGLTFGGWSRDDRCTVLLAALFHDLGKPRSLVTSPEGRPQFPGHDDLGASIVDDIAARWRMSGTLRGAVRHLVGTHLALGYCLHGPRDGGARWDLRMLLDPCTPHAVVLSVADRFATAGRADRRAWVRAHLAFAREVWVDHWRVLRDGVVEPLLDGHAICSVTGLTPSREVGRIVHALARAQAVDGITSIEAATSLARALASGSSSLSESTDRST